jgi:uncharacterized protein
MAFFFCRLTPPRPSFALDMSPAEKSTMAAHAAYWQAQADKGAAVIFGPVADPKGVWGLGIVEAETEAQARALIAADPVTSAELGLGYEIYPMMAAIVRRSAHDRDPPLTREDARSQARRHDNAN